MIGLRPFRPHEPGVAFDVGAHPLPPRTVDALARWFGFTPDELALNRAGCLSTRQRQNVLFQGVRVIVLGVVLIVLNVMLAAAVAPGARSGPQQAAFGALIVLIAAIIVLVLRAAGEVLFPRVRCVCGPLSPAGSARQPLLRAGDRLLAISYRRWRRLGVFGDRPYRAYYAGRTLLSVEPGDDP